MQYLTKPLVSAAAVIKSLKHFFSLSFPFTVNKQINKQKLILFHVNEPVNEDRKHSV